MPKQILLVEDSTTMTKVVEITFAHEDYQITSAKDADEALLRLREVRPDLVVADANLLGKSGYDLCALLKADSALREVPVLLLTGNFSPYDDARGQKAGVDAYVVKPFETQVLLDKVADLLRRRGSSSVAAGAPTLVSMPPLQVPHTVPVGAVAATETRRGTIPPQPPPRVAPGGIPPASMSPPPQVSGSPSVAPLGTPVGGPLGIPGGPRPPQQQPPAALQATVPPADPSAQRSTLMGIPAVNPLGTGGMRPPPPPGMMMRQTGNMPAINPGPGPGPSPTPSPNPVAGAAGVPTAVGTPIASPAAQAAPVVSGAAAPWPARSGSVAPQAPLPPGSMVAQVQTMGLSSQQNQSGGIPTNAPQMPRPSLIPRAPIPATVVATLERIAQRGAEYEAIAKLSMEVIEQIVWEVVPDLAEAMIRAEMDRIIKDRDRR